MSDNADDYLWNKAGPPDPEVAHLEGLLGSLAHDPAKQPLDELRLRRAVPSRKTAWVVGGVVATLAVAALIALVVLPRGGPCAGGHGMAFEGSGGEVTCAGVRVAKGVLPEGKTLDTGAHGAALKIATIGTVDLGANTVVRLDRTSEAGHNLHLAHGTMHAWVDAPPRLFAITTPSTAVTDLGCEYEIEVDARGSGSIRVLSGKVELAAREGLIVVAPAGTHASILPGNRPGLPIATTATPELEAAVHAYERGEADGIARILAAATDSDAITLVNLAILEPTNLTVLQRLGVTSAEALQQAREDIVGTQIFLDGLLDR